MESYKIDMHMDEKHPEKQDKPFDFTCKESGCDASYTSGRSLNLHRHAVHVKRVPVKKVYLKECPICKETVKPIIFFNNLEKTNNNL